MARTLEQVYFDMLLNQIKQTAQLLAALEAAHDRITQLEATMKAQSTVSETAGP